ncbi:MDR family MFS transporter [Adhaeribacter aquaticus]|uniref:MDR family MFS transporter n=1 Tax=Adhaeribacter aquaticus TaxID=299567 RepID=UPI000403385F|nr:MFS transporter [Adhaeribacter aquaticus]
MTRLFELYRNAFGGLSKPTWMLAAMMLINRSGAMVIPFLSVYLTEALHLNLKQAGIVLSLFGLGAMGGAFLGGWLTDRVGHFKVQLWSLIISGFLFFVLAQVTDYTLFAAGILLVSTVSECLRPANSSSVAYYAKPENLTRAYSLNRMAMNLGFSIGPALAGLLATISYQWLFMADGITCLAAGLFFYFYFRHQQGYRPEKNQPHAVLVKAPSPYQDSKFFLFALLCGIYALVFFQLLSTLPLYYRQVYKLSEANIGLLLALNGMIVFLSEMIVVYVAGNRFKLWQLIASGVFLIGVSFMILNLIEATGILILSMAILSFSEILAMPFMATIPVQRSTDQNRGAYIGLYNLAYSSAFILGPFLGTNIIAFWGFTTLWWGSGILSLLTTGAIYWLVKNMQQEKTRTESASRQVI